VSEAFWVRTVALDMNTRARPLPTSSSRPFVAALACGLVALAPGSSAQAQAAGANKRLVIEVGSPNFRPYPLAVPAARELGAAAAGQGAAEQADAITEALRFDVDLSPMFQLLDPKSYLADPRREGMTADAIKFSDWTSVGAQGLLKASATTRGAEVEADFRFYDVASGKEQLRKTYKGPAADTRRFAHRFMNELVAFLTGQKGAFTARIVAANRTRTGRELTIMDLDGKGRARVTENGSINLLPSWSRDGREIFFTSYMRRNPNVYAISASGGGKARLVSGERGLNTGAVQSPDGARLALTLSRDGYVMNTDGTGLRRLTNEWAIDTSPSWSPDGKRIAFVSARWGDPQIAVMNADGSNVRRLTDRGNYNQTPDWSPRGDLIAFTARDERASFDIFTLNVETREIRRLTQGQGNNEEPSFSPDGNLITFSSTREGSSQVWVMSFDGKKQRRVTQAGGYTTPVFGPAID
jgi:TolB protein